jgi:hypothetical protein
MIDIQLRYNSNYVMNLVSICLLDSTLVLTLKFCFTCQRQKGGEKSLFDKYWDVDGSDIFSFSFARHKEKKIEFFPISRKGRET